jgi:hypothetical protein
MVVWQDCFRTDGLSGSAVWADPFGSIGGIGWWHRLNVPEYGSTVPSFLLGIPNGNCEVLGGRDPD